jgi:hypothetical protein
LALHNYHQVLESFPPAYAIVPPDDSSYPRYDYTSPGWGWGAMLLGYLEQDPLARRIDWITPIEASAHLDARTTALRIFTCPSDRHTGMFMLLSQLSEDLVRPRVAAIAATEEVVDAMPETLDAAELERRRAAGAFGQCLVQGPLTFDLAYASEAGTKKRLEGSAIGNADAMLFPNLLSANLTVKAIMNTADCRFGGVLCGAACPVVFMSRADTTSTRLNSLALALALLERSYR